MKNVRDYKRLKKNISLDGALPPVPQAKILNPYIFSIKEQF